MDRPRVSRFARPHFPPLRRHRPRSLHRRALAHSFTQTLALLLLGFALGCAIGGVVLLLDPPEPQGFVLRRLD